MTQRPLFDEVPTPTGSRPRTAMRDELLKMIEEDGPTAAFARAQLARLDKQSPPPSRTNDEGPR